MTKVDWLIVAFTVLLAMYGYAQGFIVGGLSLVGFGIGAFLGTRLAPLVLPGGSHSQYAPLFGLLGALLAGAVLASGFEGLGARARSVPAPARAAHGRRAAGRGPDRVGGARDRMDRRARSRSSRPTRSCSGATSSSSAILKGLNELLPPSGPILHALARIDPLPSVRGPAADVPAAAARDRPGPRRHGGRRERGQGAGHRVRPRDRGQRLGGRPRTWW